MFPALLAALLAAVGGIYWRTLNYPFIQDDWGQLRALVNGDTHSFLTAALSVNDGLFYRPLSLLYFLLYYRLFGLAPLPFHIIGLLIHLLNSTLVAFISWRLTGNRLLSAVSAMIYATAVTVHLDPLLWLVGFYDLSASFFYLVAIALFLSGRRFLSAAAFGFGMLAKESTVTLVFVLLLYLLYAIRPFRNRLSTVCRALWLHALILGTYLLMRNDHSAFPFSLPRAEPYAMRLVGDHLYKNLFRYIWWGLQAVTPFRDLPGSTVRWILAAAPFFIGCLYYLSRKSRRAPLFPSGWLAFLAGWAGTGIFPYLFLPNHYYRYYLIYSLPPLILLSLSGVYWVCDLISSSEKVHSSKPVVVPPDLALLSRSRTGPHSVLPAFSPPASTPLMSSILIAFVMVNALSAASYFRIEDRAGVSNRFTVGTNHLIHRGHAAALVLNYLAHKRPSVPRGSVFLLEGFDTESLGGDAGLSVFYRDDSIRVFGRSEVVLHPEGKYVEVQERNRDDGDPQSSGIKIDPGQLFCLRIRDGMVEEEDAVRAYGSE